MHVFTTGEVAKICGLAPRTVSKLLDSGDMEGFRMPKPNNEELGDRRIVKLDKFIKKNGMPIEPYEHAVHGDVMFIGNDARFIESLQERLPEQTFTFSVAESMFDAGMASYEYKPDCIVFDLSHAKTFPKSLAQCLWRMPIPLFVILPDNNQILIKWRNMGLDVFKRPFDIDLVVARIRTVVSKQKNLE